MVKLSNISHDGKLVWIVVLHNVLHIQKGRDVQFGFRSLESYRAVSKKGREGLLR